MKELTTYGKVRGYVRGMAQETELGPGKWSVKITNARPCALSLSLSIYIYIYIYICDSCWLPRFHGRFIECVWARATFLNGFLRFGAPIWRFGGLTSQRLSALCFPVFALACVLWLELRLTCSFHGPLGGLAALCFPVFALACVLWLESWASFALCGPLPGLSGLFFLLPFFHSLAFPVLFSLAPSLSIYLSLYIYIYTHIYIYIYTHTYNMNFR